MIAMAFDAKSVNSDGPATPVVTKIARRSLRFWAGVLLVLLVGVGFLCAGLSIALWSTPASISHVPQLTSDEQQVAIAAINQQLKAIDATTDAPETPSPQEHAWQMTLTQPQMQAWIQQNLPSQPSYAIPGSMANPRIYLRDGHATLACEYNSKSIRSVVSLEMEPFAVAELNQLGIYLRNARAGWVPVPLRKVLWRIMLLANDAGLRMQTSDDSEVVTARIFFPVSHQGKLIEIQKCNVTKDGLVLAGVVRSAPIGQDPSSQDPSSQE